MDAVTIARPISTMLLILLTSVASATTAAPKQTTHAQSVVITILSTNLADGSTVGEWGFSALVQVDGRCLLFDAGRHPDTVVKNAEALGIDLACVTDVVLSHFHFDHTNGLLPILREARLTNPDALRRIHVAQGFFLSRRMVGTSGPRGDTEVNTMIAMREPLEAAGVEFIEYSQPTEVMPGVWVTGPVIRHHPETNYPKTIQVNIDGKWVEDYVPESQGLTVVTATGPIVLLGCGHSGAVNLLEQVQATIQSKPIHALMGGMHLFSADDQTLGWTADRLRDIGVEHLMAGHCTGIEPLFRLRSALNLTRGTAVVGAVGSRFVYGEGIHPTAIAQ